jgi:hypothetical protein
MTAIVGFAATLWVIAYLAWTLRHSRGAGLPSAPGNALIQAHPGECWVVLAHAVAFGSGYVLGASNASFLLVLAVHHEVQYLYFAYAMARRPQSFHAVSGTEITPVLNIANSSSPSRAGPKFRTEKERVASFLVWPVIGFVGAVVGGWSNFQWLAPLGMGGLFCHYWLDGRIWMRRSLNG